MNKCVFLCIENMYLPEAIIRVVKSPFPYLNHTYIFTQTDRQTDG
jgi:hypothetical protein